MRMWLLRAVSLDITRADMIEDSRLRRLTVRSRYELRATGTIR